MPLFSYLFRSIGDVVGYLADGRVGLGSGVGCRRLLWLASHVRVHSACVLYLFGSKVILSCLGQHVVNDYNTRH